ncbi:MAG TPA: AraC family transcriptional regulator [Candidatus Angelobacter sp.]|nr:AraC family transcriptional regulator [Candidatus Angelobacter sp.]
MNFASTEADVGSETITAITPRIVVEECRQRGWTERHLLAGTGISPAAIRQPAGKISIDAMYGLWERVIQLTANPMLAVEIAKAVPFGTYKLMDYLFAVSSSMAEALERSARFFCLFNNAFALRFRLHRDAAYLELHNASGNQDLPRVYVEYVLTNYLVRSRMIAGDKASPIEVHAAYARPGAMRNYEKYFGVPFRFNCAVNRIVFPRCIKSALNQWSDPELCEILESHAERKLCLSSGEKNVVAEIRGAIAHSLKTGHVSLGHISRQLAKSSRGLQREIHSYGASFSELLDDVRRDHAISLLSDREMPLSEIASRLQFSGSSAFCRAFQRWTGNSPHKYRTTLN